MNKHRSALPIDEALPRLRSALGSSPRVVLSAPPGAGKTTGVPLALLEEPWLKGKKIIMLEPRRLAARRSAAYMAQLCNERIGQTVGYRIRGDAVVGGNTRIEVVTEGILTRMLHAEPELPGAGLVIFDEFHERSIHADLGLAFTLDIQKHLRDDLRILVMSATLDGVAVARLLGGAPVVESAGKSFPVETRYARFASDKPLEARVVDAVLRALASDEGDVLVFLPGMREIRRVEEQLHARVPEGVVTHMLHGDLPPRVQEEALSPARNEQRKVILSTSIAETSLTIDGVRIVVDSGLARAARFDPRRGMSGLVTIPVSQAIAGQRRGRAGRQGPGICYRLWTEQEHKQLQEHPVPEMRTSDLAHLVLDLARWGTPNGEGLVFLDPPPEAHVLQARSVLMDLEAMAEDGKLTAHGRAMADLPIHPRLVHMIMKGKELGCGESACELAALLEEPDFLGGGAKGDVDLSSRVEEFRQGRTGAPGIRDRVASQIARLKALAKIGHSGKFSCGIGTLVALAYPERIARKRPERSGSYQLAGGTTAMLPAGSTLSRNEFLAIADVDAGSREARIYLAAPIKERDLEATVAGKIVSEQSVQWDAAEQRVSARRVRRVGSIILGEQTIQPGDEEIQEAMLEGIKQAGLGCLPWDKDADRFRARVLWAAKSVSDLSGLPDLSDDALMETRGSWLAPHIHGMQKLEHLKRLHLADILRSLVPQRELRELDRLVPATLVVPSGSRISIDYTVESQPSLAVKLQELFGLTETPRIGNGRIPITIHLLSPAGRPLAVTQDLHSFWLNTYPKIRNQLRARYPKHPWPDNPLTAAPTRKTIRKK